MNLRQLGYFKSVVDHGSLAAASEVLRVAQPNLSVAIKQLETEWQVALFDRMGRGLILTDTGRVLYERASQLLGSASALGHEMQAIGRGASARVRVGFTAVSLEVVTQMVAALSVDGGVSFSLHQGEPRFLETMVESRELDFAITHMPIANPALHVQPVAAPDLMLVARDGDARWPTDSVALKDMPEVPIALLRRSSGIGIFDQVQTALDAAGVTGRIIADSTDLPAIYALVRSGIAIGLVPMLAHAALPPDLRSFPIEAAPALERLALIYPRGRQLLPAVQTAMDHCRRLLAAV